MSDDESFVILGSSPLSSLENDGLEYADSSNSSLESDTPDSRCAYSFEDFALKTSLQHQQNAKKNITPSSLNSEEISKPKTTQHLSANNDLAAGLIMGDIDLDVLKTSVYSQFPSISTEARPEELMKLQSMVSEYNELKHAIRMANSTMKLFYDNSLLWKDKMKANEEEYKNQLEICKNEIEELRKRNNETEMNFKAQIEAIEIARKKDREEQIQIVSEKEAVLQNMRAQIVKLESKQASFDYLELSNSQINYKRSNSNEMRQVHDDAINVKLKNLNTQYMEEINLLKVKLIATEEIVNKNRAEIIELRTRNKENDDKIVTLEATLRSMVSAYEEQEERIVLLKTQNKVHCKDFEMEKQSRESAVTEKQQILHDLRLLQKRNQELIEEHQKLAENFQKKLSLANKDELKTSFEAAAHADFNNPQRPIRVLPSSSTSAAPSETAKHICPICNKAFKSLNILLSHAYDCVGTI